MSLHYQNTHKGEVPSREILRTRCKLTFEELQKYLKLKRPQIIQNGPDLHYIGVLSDGTYLHIRTWIQHMYDCEDHKNLIREGKIFIGGYRRDTFETGVRQNPEYGEESTFYGLPFFEYGWFENEALAIAKMIFSTKNNYFENPVGVVLSETNEKIGKNFK